MRMRMIIAAVMVLVPITAIAQDRYPSRPVRVLLGLPAGGPTDLTARVVAVKLSGLSGQQFIVDNRPGAGGTIAGELAAKAAPDGYTLYLAGISIAIRAAISKHLSYDPVKDVTPISLLVTTPNVLVANTALPVKSIKELIAYSKAHPGQLRYGSSGVGNSPHLSMELLTKLTGMDVTHIPYKGTSIAMPDLFSGQIQLVMDNLPGQVPNIKAGKVRALAVTSAQRSRHVPDVPTVVEQGVPGYEVTVWLGLFGPPRLPQSIVAVLHGHVTRGLAAPEVQKRLFDAGADVATSTPRELGAHLDAEAVRWAQVVKDAGVPAE